MPRVILFGMQKDRRAMNRHQLEMNFDSITDFKPARRGRGRVTRARWWFAQMRQVVERTWNSFPTPSVGREQVCSQSLAPVQN